MSRSAVGAVMIAATVVSSAVGYWFGFREALNFGVAAELLPRGSIATVQLEQLEQVKTQKVKDALAFDADNGLLWAHELFGHPLRDLLASIWRFNFYPGYEEYVKRLAA